MTPNDLPYGGLVNYVAYFMALLQEVWAHLFELGGDHLAWSKATPDGGIDPSSTQWIITGNLPDLTPKAEDIVAAIMTIVHNGLVAVAQLSTLLPANALT